MHLLTSDTHLELAMAIATLSLHNKVAVIGHVDSIDENKKRIEEYARKIELKSVPELEIPIIQHCSPQKYRPSKHKCSRKLSPRKNKTQAKSRRANRK